MQTTARLLLWAVSLLVLSSVSTYAADPPAVQISNGVMRASVYLPDSDRGYYRGGRFDWSGVISRLEYAGHNYFGVWFPNYEPTLHDAITGPVEEFRSDEGALGFAEAKPGDLFVKIGVGVLQKPDSKPYEFARNYRIVSTGVWVIRPQADRIEFTQELKGINGYAYVYTKKLRLVKGRPELILEHSLKNTGKRAITTQVYDHDFYVIDGQPTSPGFSVKFPFKPKPVTELNEAAVIRGNEVVYQRDLRAGDHDSVAGYLTGFGASPKDYDIRVENSKVKAGVEQTGDRPLSKLYLWSVRTTVCPEAYIALNIEPKKTAKWQIKYRFYTLPERERKGQATPAPVRVSPADR